MSRGTNEKLTLAKRGQGVVRLHVWLRLVQADTDGGQILAQRRTKSALSRRFSGRKE